MKWNLVSFSNAIQWIDDISLKNMVKKKKSLKNTPVSFQGNSTLHHGFTILEPPSQIQCPKYVWTHCDLLPKGVSWQSSMTSRIIKEHLCHKFPTFLSSRSRLPVCVNCLTILLPFNVLVLFFESGTCAVSSQGSWLCKLQKVLSQKAQFLPIFIFKSDTFSVCFETCICWGSMPIMY